VVGGRRHEAADLETGEHQTWSVDANLRTTHVTLIKNAVGWTKFAIGALEGVKSEWMNGREARANESGNVESRNSNHHSQGGLDWTKNGIILVTFTVKSVISSIFIIKIKSESFISNFFGFSNH